MLCFFVPQAITSCETKTLRGDRHAAVENFVAEAIRRRRRSLRAGKQTESAPIANMEMQWYNRVKWGEYEHINTVLEKGQTYAKDYRV